MTHPSKQLETATPAYGVCVAFSGGREEDGVQTIFLQEVVTGTWNYIFTDDMNRLFPYENKSDANRIREDIFAMFPFARVVVFAIEVRKMYSYEVIWRYEAEEIDNGS